MPQLVVRLGLVTAVRLTTSTGHPILNSADQNYCHQQWPCLTLKTGILAVLSMSDGI